VIITASATADKIADAGDYVFRIVPPNSKQGSDLAQFCLGKLHAKRAAILYQTNDYGLTLRDAFDKTFRELGGVVVGAEGYPLGATDYRAALTKLKTMKPDVVFYPLHQAEAALMLRQAKELGYGCDFVSADGAYTEDLIKAAGSAAEGSYFSTMALAYGVADQAISQFQSRFKAKFNQDPDVYSAYYYEVTNLVAQVIKDNGSSGEEIRKGLYALTGSNAYHGITGVTAFDAKGEVNKAFYIYQVKNGGFHLVGPPL
jgi:branched-chain amino acid transport system substrate-binding protein